jgi:hypothetical protein
MSIEVRRVGRKWPRRYVVKVTPPNGEWDTQRPMGRLMIKRRLFADKAHIQDVAHAFAEADAKWRNP